MVINKRSWIELVSDRDPIVLELGCGEHKRFESTIGIDKLDLPGVDFVADLDKGLEFIPDNSIDKIYSNHFLEHINDVPFLISEISRVLKPGGLKVGWVPHWSNPLFYSDPTHKTFFGLYTFLYLSNTSLYSRKVPRYQENELILEKNLLLIKSTGKKIPFASKLLMKLINHNELTQFVYEKYLFKFISVNELYFHLRKK